MVQPIRLYLVRHGHARAGFAEAADPGLDEVGWAQAGALARELAPLGPLPLMSSPLRRARETAVPLEKLWGVRAHIEPAFSEIPSPTRDLQARATWLRQAVKGRWGDLPEVYQAWRAWVVATLLGLRRTTVVISHFVAINAAAGMARGEDCMICFEPDHCSCTILESLNGTLRLVCLGRQRPARILITPPLPHKPGSA